MEKYLINEETVAILKKDNKTIFYNVENIQVFNKNIKKILEFNCNYYGSSYQGRKKSSQNILNIKYKLPIMISENLILLQLNSLRDKECLFIVLNKIINFEKNGDNLKIYCQNKIVLNSKISIKSLEKLIVEGIKLQNILNCRKRSNLL